MPSKALPMAMVTNTPSLAPPSFGGDMSLYALNLFLMTAMFFLGLMLAWRQASRIWDQRAYDHALDPVSLCRLITMLAGAAVMPRCGARSRFAPNPPNPAQRSIFC